MMDDKTQFESGDEVDSSRHIGCMCQQRNGTVYSAVRSRGLLLLKVPRGLLAYEASASARFDVLSVELGVYFCSQPFSSSCERNVFIW